MGVDSSPEMLSIAQSKAFSVDEASIPPVFIMQDMRSLDLFGTVRAAVCTLDGINHILEESELRETFRRLSLFIEPGGTLVFDINTPYKLSKMDGCAFLDETDDVFCAWSTVETEKSGIFEFCIDVFTRRGKLWHRETESFSERAWKKKDIEKMLTASGFGEIEVFGDRKNCPPADDEYRVFIAAKRL